MTAPLPDTRLAEIRERHALKVSMGLINADDNEGVLLAEIERLHAKVEERRVELRDRRTEDLTLRGLLAPNGLPRRIPMELGESLAPAVEWLLAELAKYVSHEPTIAEEWQYLRSECQRVEADNERLAVDLATAHADALNRGAAVLDHLADTAEARVLAHYNGACGTGSCDLVRESARTLREMAATHTVPTT